MDVSSRNINKTIVRRASFPGSSEFGGLPMIQKSGKNKLRKRHVTSRVCIGALSMILYAFLLGPFLNLFVTAVLATGS